MIFFFFKQKTAYEMRISDWSSDVCSSDLILHWSRLHREHPPPVDSVFRAPSAVLKSAGLQSKRGRHPDRRLCTLHQKRSEERRVGKSVSVRVDLGGRRIIKKKTNNKTNKE